MRSNHPSLYLSTAWIQVKRYSDLKIGPLVLFAFSEHQEDQMTITETVITEGMTALTETVFIVVIIVTLKANIDQQTEATGIVGTM